MVQEFLMGRVSESPGHLYTRLRCNDRRCGWVSREMNREEVRELGVPWYCDDCGQRVSNFIHYNAWERGEVDYLWNLKGA